MNATIAAVLQILVLVIALAVVYRPFGDYMARSLESPRHTRVERGIYRVIGVDPSADQRWSVYLRAVLAFSIVSIVVLFALLRLQAYLPYSLGREGMPSLQSLNTAVSFVTNTNWQSYSGEAALGYSAQMAGLAVQNFLSAAVGIAVAIALVRGLARTHTDRLGNFWVDVTRITLRVLLPLAVVFGIALLVSGVVQNFAGDTTLTTLTGATQTIPGGPVASQEVIKELGTNGGGFYNANSAHPFENPNGLTNLIEIFLHPGHPVQPDPHLRPDRRRPSPGLRDPRGDGIPVGVDHGPAGVGRGQPRRPGPATGRGSDGGQGGALRRADVRRVRRCHDGYVHGRGRLDASTRSPPTAADWRS